METLEMANTDLREPNEIMMQDFKNNSYELVTRERAELMIFPGSLKMVRREEEVILKAQRIHDQKVVLN